MLPKLMRFYTLHRAVRLQLRSSAVSMEQKDDKLVLEFSRLNIQNKTELRVQTTVVCQIKINQAFNYVKGNTKELS